MNIPNFLTDNVVPNDQDYNKSIVSDTRSFHSSVKFSKVNENIGIFNATKIGTTYLFNVLHQNEFMNVSIFNPELAHSVDIGRYSNSTEESRKENLQLYRRILRGEKDDYQMICLIREPRSRFLSAAIQDTIIHEQPMIEKMRTPYFETWASSKGYTINDIKNFLHCLKTYRNENSLWNLSEEKLGTLNLNTDFLKDVIAIELKEYIKYQLLYHQGHYSVYHPVVLKIKNILGDRCHIIDIEKEVLDESLYSLTNDDRFNNRVDVNPQDIDPLKGDRWPSQVKSNAHSSWLKELIQHIVDNDFEIQQQIQMITAADGYAYNEIVLNHYTPHTTKYTALQKEWFTNVSNK